MKEGMELTAPAAEACTPRRFYRSPCFWLGAALFLFALGLRLAYVQEYTSSIGIDYFLLDQTDNHTFNQWAQGIAEGDWLCRNQIHPYHNWTAEVAPEEQWLEWYGSREVYHQAPLYPYLVGSLYALFGTDVLYVRLFQALMGAATVLFVFLTARLYFGRNTALAAGFVLALSGFHYYYDVFILREGLIAFLTVVFLYFASLAFKSRSIWLFAWSGFFLGLGVAAKPNALMLLPFYLAALFVFLREEPLRRRSLLAVVLIASALIPLAPIYARNAALDLPTFKITTRGPTAFINGNLRGQTGTVWNPPPAQTRAILWECNYKLTGAVRETLKSYADNPPAYVGLLWNKTKAFFNSYEIPNNTNYYLIRGVSRTLKWGFVSYWFLASAALAGILLLLPRWRLAWQLYLVAALLSAGTIAFFIVARFRQPLVPILALFAGYGVIWVLKRVRGRQWASLLPVLAAFGFFLYGTDHDELTYSTEMSAYSGVMRKLAAQEEFERAGIFKEKLLESYRTYTENLYYPHLQDQLDKIEEAFSAFDEGMLYAEEDARRHASIARGFLLMMEVTKAAEFEEFAKYTREKAEKTMAMDPRTPGIHKTLAVCYHLLAQRRSGDQQFPLLAKALHHCREAVEADPEDATCHKIMGYYFDIAGSKEDAVRHYKLYLKFSEEWDYEIASQVARIRIYQPKPDEARIAEALAFAKEAYRHDPDDLRFLENYASALYLAGRFDEAVEILERMIVLNPESSEEYEGRIEGFLKVKERREKEAAEKEEEQ